MAQSIFSLFKRALIFTCVILLIPLQSVVHAKPSSKSSVVRKTKSGSKKATAVATKKALEQVGKPYKYGGASPRGFDCSGLVQYSYKQAGIKLPRKTGELRRVTKPIAVKQLREGDLVFFDQEGKKSSHVGIYAGKGRFVHAPSTGGKVNVGRIKSPYWSKHLAEARRINLPKSRSIKLSQSVTKR